MEAASKPTRALHSTYASLARTSKPMADACLRTGTHYLDITGEAQSEIAAHSAKLVLCRAQRRPIERLERVLEAFRVVASVQNELLAVSVHDAHVMRHLIQPQGVLAPKVGTVYLEGARGRIAAPRFLRRATNGIVATSTSKLILEPRGLPLWLWFPT